MSADEGGAPRGPSRAPAPRSGGSRRPGPGRSRRATRGSRSARAASRSWRRRPPGRGTGVPRGSSGRRGPPSPGGRRRSARPRCRRRGRGARLPASARASTAVEACVPLISASPSFGPRLTGERPAFASAAAPGNLPVAVPGEAFADEDEREVRERARGRRSRRPSRGSARRGCTPRFSASSSASSVSSRMPEKPRASTLARSAIIARTVRTGSGSPDAGRVAPEQVQLQALEVAARDLHLGERPEPGVDAVDRRVAVGHAVDHGARGRDARAGIGARPTGAASSATAMSWSSVSERPSSANHGSEPRPARGAVAGGRRRTRHRTGFGRSATAGRAA